MLRLWEVCTRQRLLNEANLKRKKEFNGKWNTTSNLSLRGGLEVIVPCRSSWFFFLTNNFNFFFSFLDALDFRSSWCQCFTLIAVLPLAIPLFWYTRRHLCAIRILGSNRRVYQSHLEWIMINCHQGAGPPIVSSIHSTSSSTIVLFLFMNYHFSWRQGSFMLFSVGGAFFVFFFVIDHPCIISSLSFARKVGMGELILLLREILMGVFLGVIISFQGSVNAKSSLDQFLAPQFLLLYYRNVSRSLRLSY